MEYFTLSLSVGVLAALDSICGHELFHKKEWYNKLVGQFAYTRYFYSHFFDEHLQGHHKAVATTEDPATALYGQSIYQFIPSAIVGSHVTTWKREMKKSQKLFGADSSTIQLIISNKITLYFCIHSIMLGVIYHTLGMQSVKFQLCYAALAVSFLETVNYVEHYGLLRKKDSNGVYESITNMHSWNSASTKIMWRLQRHSDHHHQAYRPYQILKTIDQAPTYPFDYNYAIIIALVPPVWFYCVNPRIDAIKAKEQG